MEIAIQTVAEDDKAVGDVVKAYSAEAIRKRWLYILCVCMAPQNRKSFTTLPYYDHLQTTWMPVMSEIYAGFNADNEAMIQTKTLDEAWAGLCSWGTIQNLPRVPGRKSHITSSWTWTPKQLSTCLIVSIPDAAADPHIASQVTCRKYPLLPTPTEQKARFTVPAWEGLTKDAEPLKDPNQVVMPYNEVSLPPELLIEAKRITGTISFSTTW